MPTRYLRVPIEDIAAFIKISPVQVLEALQILWTMDPHGVGARDLRECMMLQLRYRGLENTLAMKIIENTWDLFEKLKFPKFPGILRWNLVRYRMRSIHSVP